MKKALVATKKCMYYSMDRKTYFLIALVTYWLLSKTD